jgi:DNA-directed RNA polymerase specialized sigma subunit
MRLCAKICMKMNTPCKESECRNHINYEEDQNCVLIAISKNDGPLTLRQIAPRMGISFPRVKQIQDQAIKKIRKELNDNELRL